MSFPFDEGTTRNGGYSGAANGPSIFRQHLFKIGSLENPEFNVNLSHSCELYDLGDIYLEKNHSTLEEAHLKLRKTVKHVLTRGYIPFIIGGSNDQSFPNAMGLIDAIVDKKDIGVINLDAHLDCRPLTFEGLAHSGSPFYQLLIEPNWNGKFIEFGVQGHQCSKKHYDFVRRYGGEVIWFTKNLQGKDVADAFKQVLKSINKKNIFVSFDVDSISNSWCDSVSCSSPLGFTAEQALKICYNSGKCPYLRLIDISEFNPAMGNCSKTGRLLATLFYYFLLGVNSL